MRAPASGPTHRACATRRTRAPCRFDRLCTARRRTPSPGPASARPTARPCSTPATRISSGPREKRMGLSPPAKSEDSTKTRSITMLMLRHNRRMRWAGTCADNKSRKQVAINAICIQTNGYRKASSVRCHHEGQLDARIEAMQPTVAAEVKLKIGAHVRCARRLGSSRLTQAVTNCSGVRMLAGAARRRESLGQTPDPRRHQPCFGQDIVSSRTTPPARRRRSRAPLTGPPRAGRNAPPAIRSWVINKVVPPPSLNP